MSVPLVTRCVLVAGTALLAVSQAAAASAAGGIVTVAGTGQAADGGNGGPALKTNIGQPFGVEFGPDGALYVCEVQNHRLRRLDTTSGQVTNVAGSGRAGYAGDGGPATEALLNEPYEVRFDPAGTIFFVEMKNHLVRRVDAKTGVIATVAGTGKSGFGGDGGPATKALFASPHSIALDPGKNGGPAYLYVADIGNHRIRRVDLATGTIDSIAGTGEQRLPADGQRAAGNPVIGPRALFLQGRTLWVALREGHSVWRLELDGGTWHHVAGNGKAGYGGDGGPARAAAFNGPKGIALDDDGNIFVVDTENQAIRRIDAKTSVITTVAGAGPSARGGAGDGGPATKAQLDRPHGICVGADFSLYIGDTNNHRVRRVLTAK
jgi:sugar lactone lactonase YvrE